MATTIKQKKLARVIVENSTLDAPLQKGEMLSKVGYSKTVAKHKPQDIIDAEGVQQELINLGFTEENAMTVVSDIMLNDEADNSSRLKATDQVFKVRGSYAPEKRESVNLNVNIDNTKASKIANEYEDKLKEELLADEENNNENS